MDGSENTATSDNLTSTMGNVLARNSENENATNDSLPSSSSDANVATAAITQEDPISSTSEEVDSVTSNAVEVKMESKKTEPPVHSGDENPTPEKNFEDIASELENLLEESAEEYKNCGNSSKVVDTSSIDDKDMNLDWDLDCDLNMASKEVRCASAEVSTSVSQYNIVDCKENESNLGDSSNKAVEIPSSSKEISEVKIISQTDVVSKPEITNLIVESKKTADVSKQIDKAIISDNSCYELSEIQDDSIMDTVDNLKSNELQESSAIVNIIDETSLIFNKNIDSKIDVENDEKSTVRVKSILETEVNDNVENEPSIENEPIVKHTDTEVDDNVKKESSEEITDRLIETIDSSVQSKDNTLIITESKSDCNTDLGNDESNDKSDSCQNYVEKNNDKDHLPILIADDPNKNNNASCCNIISENLEDSKMISNDKLVEMKHDNVNFPISDNIIHEIRSEDIEKHKLNLTEQEVDMKEQHIPCNKNNQCDKVLNIDHENTVKMDITECDENQLISHNAEIINEDVCKTSEENIKDGTSYETKDQQDTVDDAATINLAIKDDLINTDINKDCSKEYDNLDVKETLAIDREIHKKTNSDDMSNIEINDEKIIVNTEALEIVANKIVDIKENSLDNIDRVDVSTIDCSNNTIDQSECSLSNNDRIEENTICSKEEEVVPSITGESIENITEVIQEKETDRDVKKDEQTTQSSLDCNSVLAVELLSTEIDVKVVNEDQDNTNSEKIDSSTENNIKEIIETKELIQVDTKIQEEEATKYTIINADANSVEEAMTTEETVESAALVKNDDDKLDCVIEKENISVDVPEEKNNEIKDYIDESNTPKSLEIVDASINKMDIDEHKEEIPDSSVESEDVVKIVETAPLVSGVTNQDVKITTVEDTENVPDSVRKDVELLDVVIDNKNLNDQLEPVNDKSTDNEDELHKTVENVGETVAISEEKSETIDITNIIANEDDGAIIVKESSEIETVKSVEEMDETFQESTQNKVVEESPTELVQADLSITKDIVQSCDAELLDQSSQMVSDKEDLQSDKISEIENIAICEKTVDNAPLIVAEISSVESEKEHVELNIVHITDDKKLQVLKKDLSSNDGLIYPEIALSDSDSSNDNVTESTQCKSKENVTMIISSVSTDTISFEDNNSWKSTNLISESSDITKSDLYTSSSVENLPSTDTASDTSAIIFGIKDTERDEDKLTASYSEMPADETIQAIVGISRSEDEPYHVEEDVYQSVGTCEIIQESEHTSDLPREIFLQNECSPETTANLQQQVESMENQYIEPYEEVEEDNLENALIQAAVDAEHTRREVKEKQRKQLAEEQAKLREQAELVRIERERKRLETERARKLLEEEEQRERELLERQIEDDRRIKEEKKLAEQRKIEEEQRQRDEAKRKVIEDERKKLEAEKKRIDDEKKRVELEKQRIEDEKKRVEEEKKRAEEEKKRAEEEKKRVEEEMIRAELEKKRVEEENKRLEEENKRLEEKRKRLDEEKKKLEEIKRIEEERKLKADEKLRLEEEERVQQQIELDRKMREIENEKILAAKKIEEHARILAASARKAEKQENSNEQDRNDGDMLKPLNILVEAPSTLIRIEEAESTTTKEDIIVSEQPSESEEDNKPEYSSKMSSQDLKMTITKHKTEETDTILKIYDPKEDYVEEDAPVTRKLKIKPIVEPNVATVRTEDSALPKITFKPLPEKLPHSPKRSLRNLSPSRPQSPKVTIKPVVKPSEILSPLKIIIKPVLKQSKSSKDDDALEEMPSQHNSPKLIIKTVLKDSEDINVKLHHSPKISHKSDCERSNSPKITLKLNKKEQSPKLNIKPVIKPKDEDTTLVEPLKINIKQIPKDLSCSTISPKTSKKTINIESQDNFDSDDAKPERIVLKINKSDYQNVEHQHANRKREANEDIERLAKIKLKVSKRAGHAHIVNNDLNIQSVKRCLPEGIELVVDSKRARMIETLHTQGVTITPIVNEPVERFQQQQQEELSSDSVIFIGEEHQNDPLEGSEISVTPIVNKTPGKRGRVRGKGKTVTTPRRGRGRPRKIPLLPYETEPEDYPPTPPAKLSTSHHNDSLEILPIESFPVDTSEDTSLANTSNSSSTVPEEEGSELDTSSTTTSTGRPKRSCRGPSVRTQLGIKTRKSRTRGPGGRGSRGPRGGGLRGGGLRGGGVEKTSTFQRISDSKLTLIKEAALSARITDAFEKQDIAIKIVDSVAEECANIAKLDDDRSDSVAEIIPVPPQHAQNVVSDRRYSDGAQQYRRKIESVEPVDVIDITEDSNEETASDVKVELDPETEQVLDYGIKLEVLTVDIKEEELVPKVELVEDVVEVKIEDIDIALAGKELTVKQLKIVIGKNDQIDPEDSRLINKDVEMYEEETRMSADGGSRAETPAKQISPPPAVMTSDVIVEESQSSIQSTATTESVKAKTKSRGEVTDEAVPIVSPDQLAEYNWNGEGPFMLQEQVAQYLGITSFKRKYPNIQRRTVDMHERDFIREGGLASEALCNLGLTVLCSADVLDIMYTDFHLKYEEFCKYVRDRQTKEITSRQRAMNLAANQEKNKQDLLKQAVQSAAQWNMTFNKTRREERSACMDLQTFTVCYPRGKRPIVDRGRVGQYPLALVPGQYTDYYQTYTPTELNNLPFNTMLYEPINISNIISPQSPDIDLTTIATAAQSDSGSDSDGSDSDTSSSGSSGSSSSDDEDDSSSDDEGLKSPIASVPVGICTTPRAPSIARKQLSTAAQ